MLRVVRRVQISVIKKKTMPMITPQVFQELYTCIDPNRETKMMMGIAYIANDSFQLGPAIATNGK